MKKNLLILISFFVITSGWSQVKSGNEPAAAKLKRNGEIIREPETEMNVSVYPNPSTGIINLSLSGFNGKKTSLRVVNVIGTIVYQEIIASADAKINKSIDMSKFAHGLYYIKLEADDYNEIRKIVLK
jgi:hypothetical protein